MKILLFVLLPILGVGQSLHEGIKPMPKLDECRRTITAVKYNVKTLATSQCDATIYSNAIVLQCGSTVKQFDLVHEPAIYRDDKGKLVEMVIDKNYFVLKATTTTYYLLTKK